MGGVITGSLYAVDRAGGIVTNAHHYENAINSDFTVTLGGAAVGILIWDPLGKRRQAEEDAKYKKEHGG